jgi:hypothetical protein
MRINIFTIIYILLISCNNKKSIDTNTYPATTVTGIPITNQDIPITNKVTSKPLDWYCSNLLNKPVSSVRSILGPPTDCYNCSSKMGEIQYSNAVADPLGVVHTLKIHYYNGVVRWLQYGSSLSYTDDGTACRVE